MGSQTVSINITAKDGASSVFTKVASTARSAFSGLASGAKQGAGGLKEIGSAGTAASAGLNKVDGAASKAAGNLNKLGSSSKQASTGVKDLGDKATTTGAALGTMVAALGKVGAAAETQRRQVDGIRKAYGEAADEILEFTERIQDTTVFSNEDARDAAQIAATLAQNYGFTTAEIEKLIDVSADLAAVKGIDLADAVQRTSAAMRGEAESAEFLGLTLNQQAIDREGLTLKMSNEEAAHFRLNALLEQSAYAEGAAGEAAATAAGQAAQAANRFQDLATSVGQMLGPVAGSAAGLADMSIALTLGGAAAGKFIGGLSGVGTKLASLVGMINPVGLAITALVLAGGAVVAAWQINEQANASLADSYTSLSAAIEATMTAQQALAASQVRFDFDQAGQLQHLADTYGITENAAQDFFNYLGGVHSTFEQFNVTTQEQAKMNELLAQSFANVSDEGTDVLISAMGKLESEVESFATTGDLAMSALEDLDAALAFNGDGAEYVDEAIRSLNNSYASGTIDAQTYADGLDWVANNLEEIAAQGKDAADAVNEVNKAATQAELDAARAADLAEQATLRGLEASGKRWTALADSIKEAQEAALAPSLASGMGFGLGFDEEARADVEAYGAELAAAKEEAIATAEALRGQLVPALDGASSGFAGFVQPGEDVLDTLARIAPNLDNVGGQFLQFADNLNDSKQALDAVLGSFSSLDALGSSASGAADIATKLIGEPGVWATLDDLVTNGAISVEQYNAALDAGTSIAANNTAIQEDLNAVRANQLPLLDSQVTKLAAYVDGLAGASAAEQQQALYLMDSANQAKVAAAYSTAYAASLGEIPPDVATQIIADGSQADPILGDILENFGLIEVGADGTVTVNFPNQATLDDVVESLDRVAELSAIELLINMSGGDIAEGQVERVNEIVDELDGKTATAEVAVEVDDSGLTSLDSALASGAGFGAGAGITVDVNANTEPLMAGIERIEPAPVVVPVEFSTQAAKSPLTGADAPQDQTVTVNIEAQDNASSTIARVMQAATALQAVSGSIDIEAQDNASSVIARVMQAANALQGVSGSIELNAEDNTGSVIAQAMQAANAFADGSYNATLAATDTSGSVVAQAMQAANAYASAEYNAQITATDGASSTIATPQGAADAYAAGTYQAQITANDQSSALINTVTGLATSYATDYGATLSAVDNASGTINSVSAALAALDGTVATTYVDVVQRGTLPPAQRLGGQVRGDMPTARLGRNVLVGEAGEEVVTLPFGSFVKPHGADGGGGKGDLTDNKPVDLTPEVDLEKAYKRGGDSAEAFYKGLFDEAKSAMRDVKSEINDTRFDSRGDARSAIREYMDMERQADSIFDKIERGAKYDANMRERLRREAKAASEETVRDTKTTSDRVVDTMATAGTEAGTEFSQELSSSMDLGSVMDQIGVLKDEFITSMKATAGSTDDVTGAVESFNEEVANIVGTFRGVGKSGEKELEGVTDSFGNVEESAEDMGKTVGEELGDGVTAGAEEATDALGLVSQMLGAVSSQSIDPNVGVDTGKATSGIRDVSGQLSQIDNESATPTIDVRVDDSEWEAFKKEVAAAQLGAVVTITTKEKPPPKKQLGGSIGASLDREVPRAANGRVITVGEAGEEDVLLPYGAMVMPHDASLSRRAADTAHAGNIQFFGPVTIVPPTADLHSAIVSQFMSMDRD